MVVAEFRDGDTKTYTKTLFQHDKGQRLSFEGIEIKSGTEVHFSNQEHGGISISVPLTKDSIAIPDVFFETGEYIYAWLYAKNNAAGSKGVAFYHIEDSEYDENDHLVFETADGSRRGYKYSETMYTIVIPIQRRPNIFRYEDYTDDTTEIVTQQDMEYEVEGEGMEITSLGNDGEGNPSFNSYRVDGENFIFTRP